MSASNVSNPGGQVLAVVHALDVSIIGINATRYLSVAGLVILVYDHILLFEEEIQTIWNADWTMQKFLFLFNRYITPIGFLITAHMLAGLGGVTLSTMVCRTWLPVVSVLGITSLGICNYFVARRVWALWARNHIVERLMIASFIVIYSTTFIAVAFAFVHVNPKITYSAVLRTCVTTEKPRLLMVVYSVPIALDLLIFVLTFYNAFDRPRHMDSALIMQLVTDGIVYFVLLLTLRIFNIIIFATADVAYTQLGIHFIWAMITMLVNRMLITSGTIELYPGDSTSYETPFRRSNTLQRSILDSSRTVPDSAISHITRGSEWSMEMETKTTA
ncbi:hypothetical protein M422DRAFT_27271 [Sphaerobolus stellatus SS14]|nr:hypothetical protein M422DRAFT_27271 [Sphaerobolus stellatus SS14]